MRFSMPSGPLRLFAVLLMTIAFALLATLAMTPPAMAKLLERSGDTVSQDGPPAVLIDDARIAEGDDGLRKLMFRVRLSAPSSLPVTADVRTLDTTATLASLDYTPLEVQITFAPGEVVHWLPVPVRGDTQIENDEALLVRLTNVMNATLADSEAVGMIVNDDFVKVLSIDDAAVAEGDAGTQPLTFTLHLSPPAVDPVSVLATAFDSTATLADGDYEAASTVITFAPGDSVATFVVPVVGDTQLERDEQLVVRLSQLAGGVFADSEAVGTLLHDDLPTLAIADTSLIEGQGGLDHLPFAITLSAPAIDTVTFVATTLDSTARSSALDYYATSAALTVLPGDSTATFAVAVLGDKLVERDETLRVRLSLVRGAGVADSEAVGTILNDDVPALSIADAAIAEGDSASRLLTFQVRLSAKPNAPVAFHYETLDGTALAADGDYLPIAGDTTFAVGQDLIELALPVYGDSLLETNERFTLRVTGITNATPASFDAVGTIANDERVRFQHFTTSVTRFWGGTLPPAFGDLTNDGRPDLPMYTNTGTTFAEMAGVRSLLGWGNYHGAAWCDFDRDGDMDFVQMPYGQSESSYNRTKLFVNNGSGGLTDIAPSLGMDIMGYGETPTWGDFNADGWPDLFLPFYAHESPSHSFLYLNQSGASFLEAADSAGIALRNLPIGRRPEGTSVVDWNGDGTLDVYCANHLLLNDGDAHFTDVRVQAGLPQVFDEGSQFVDYDDDGDFDLYLRVAEGPKLFRNDAGHFTDVTAQLGIGPLDWEWGDRWADLDADGDMDLLYFMPNSDGRLQVNQGDGTFREDSTFRGALFGSSLSSFADIDGDGDLDIAAGAYDRQFARNLSELVPRERTNYLRVRLEDADGKLVMHGATVRLRSLDDPRHPIQSRIVDGGSGYLGQDEYTLTFSGLGTGAYDLEVVFPSKPGALRIVGPAQNPALGGIRPGDSPAQVLVVRPTGDIALIDHQPSTTAAPVVGPVTVAGLAAASPNPARSSTSLRFGLPVEGSATLTVHDVTGRKVRTLVHGAHLAGAGETRWDLRDDAGRRVPAGLYFARFTGAGGTSSSKRIVVLQ